MSMVLMARASISPSCATCCCSLVRLVGVAGGALALVLLVDDAHTIVSGGHVVEEASRAVG